MNRQILFITGAVLLQVGILLWILLSRQLILMFGTEIKLRPQLYDPRDPFYGEYAQLTFPINTYNTAGYVGIDKDELRRAGQIYVLLKSVNDDWEIHSISKQKPSQGLFLRGKVASYYSDQMQIEYGFERYFVEEGKGGKLETLIRNATSDLNKSMNLVLRVDRSGNAVVKDLLVENSTLAQKQASWDRIRVRGFSQIRYNIEEYYRNYGRLPENLSFLKSLKQSDSYSINDPEANKAYEYFPELILYRLCTTFGTDYKSQDTRRFSDSDAIRHKKGYYCHALTIPNSIVKSAPILISPTPRLVPTLTIMENGF